VVHNPTTVELEQWVAGMLAARVERTKVLEYDILETPALEAADDSHREVPA
jgi:hypothetical protein